MKHVTPGSPVLAGVVSRVPKLRSMPLFVFGTSMFLSASLLFVVEPMIGKMLMPLLGGTPAVWNTCVVFFQAVLLAGYLYAHAALKFLGPRTQIALHLALVSSPFLIIGLLPPHIPAGWEPPVESNPAAWLLLMLLVVIGPPFFALSATTSIMQRWFADSGHKDAADPYFLYGASNAGSLLGLLAYPLLLEPLLRLHSQSSLWSGAYAIFVLLTAVCALYAWRWRACIAGPASIAPGPTAATAANDLNSTAWKTRWRWIALAFVPSSLMLGATSAITADVPAIPLFWVLPLAAYLVSFVLVFAKKPPISHLWLIERLPFLILVGLFPAISQTRFSLPILLLLYLAVLFGLALVLHGELARSRPAVAYLTEFYLCLSIGGVLGGIFNSLIAPVVFNTVFEWPLVLIFAALIRPVAVSDPAAKPLMVWTRHKDWLLPLILGICMTAVILGLARIGIKPGRVETTLVFGYSLLWCLSFGRRRNRFVLGLVAVFAASYLYAPYGQTLLARRSFFGVYRVRNSPEGHFRLFFHGGVLHGIQSLSSTAACEPLAYYARSGPAGPILRTVQANIPRGQWAFVGLGAGAMASYIQPQQSITFYEIDPLVAKIAGDPRYFTYLSHCAPSTKVVLGDARLRLRDAPDGSYSLIVLDAFSGDSIPMHLMTSEALDLYMRKLAPGGIVAFHISNLYFDLAPTLGNLARNAHLAAFIANDTGVAQIEHDAGKLPSIWVVMARDPANLKSLTSDQAPEFRWEPLPGRPDARLWTDDYSNLLGVVKSFSSRE